MALGKLHGHIWYVAKSGAQGGGGHHLVPFRQHHAHQHAPHGARYYARRRLSPHWDSYAPNGELHSALRDMRTWALKQQGLQTKEPCMIGFGPVRTPGHYYRRPPPNGKGHPKDRLLGTVHLYRTSAVIGGLVAKATKEVVVYQYGHAIKITPATTTNTWEGMLALPIICLTILLVALLGIQMGMVLSG